MDALVAQRPTNLSCTLNLGACDDCKRKAAALGGRGCCKALSNYVGSTGGTQFRVLKKYLSLMNKPRMIAVL
jgi:hypothetical protein